MVKIGPFNLPSKIDCVAKPDEGKNDSTGGTLLQKNSLHTIGCKPGRVKVTRGKVEEYDRNRNDRRHEQLHNRNPQIGPHKMQKISPCI